jgi:hypothetical protein
MTCPHDICDGSGVIRVGNFDNVEDEDCLCKIEAEQIDMDDDSAEIYD